MVKKTSQKLPAEISRKSDEFYTIEYDNNEGFLTRDVLENNFEKKGYKRHSWFYPTQSILSYDNGVLKINTTSNEEAYILTLQVATDKLRVACSCAKAVPKICTHAYHMLDKMLYSLVVQLRWFLPGGMYETAIANNAHFRLVPENSVGIEIQQITKDCAIYGMKRQREEIDINIPLNWRTMAVTPGYPTNSLSYMIISPSYNRVFPILMPCELAMDSTGTSVRKFEEFPIKLDHSYNVEVSADQLELNKIAFAMREHFHDMDGNLFEDELELDLVPKMKIIFELWVKAYPFLVNQYFIYSTRFFRSSKSRRQQVSRNDCSRVFPSLGKPELYFEFANLGECHQLTLKFKINGKAVSDVHSMGTFFIEHDSFLYILTCLKDIGVVGYMKSHHNKILVFTRQLSMFTEMVIKPLQQHYPIEFLEKKSGNSKK